MDEKIIVKSEKYNVKKLFKIMIIIGVVFSIILAVIRIAGDYSYRLDLYSDYYEDYLDHQQEYQETHRWCSGYGGELCYRCKKIQGYSSAQEYAADGLFYTFIELVNFIPFAAFALIGGLIYLWLRSYEMTITDKRVYGKVAWGKRVDLPLDSISSTSTIALFKGVAVATSSGKIAFLAVKNSAEIFEKVNALLVERQKAKNEAAPVQPSVPVSSNADELKKFKDLVDSGIITQEEFDAKKKELLGL